MKILVGYDSKGIIQAGAVYREDKAVADAAEFMADGLTVERKGEKMEKVANFIIRLMLSLITIVCGVLAYNDFVKTQEIRWVLVSLVSSAITILAWRGIILTLSAREKK